ncbi:unnamed protein product [Spodoptera littoralis]|uniref:Uncharacterized protein n=2 Tax=Spodoptera TaxID=7106 RepID=A0A9P0I9L6_SPOLI|nr:uncharacterized protein LOC111360154 [Spodoptera litura]CAB3512983.1 unnamed protein product [Spodoptera littoralis]CAH1642732.1 unnamed protein product [Spodoptera littoralis]
MSALKCVVEGCNLEYDVVCSFSFYNANISTDNEAKRQDWIEGAMHEESECLWRHVSLQLCGYHFELDNQGLWIDSPMLPELLTHQEKTAPVIQSPNDKKLAEIIRMEHNYSVEPVKEDPESVSRLNVRQLVDTLGYLSLKNLQRKQLWVVKVETDKAEASITQSEQVITKMPDPRQIIEIIPQSSTSTAAEPEAQNSEVLQIMDDTTISDNFIYEIAEEQEITMEEVKEIPATSSENPEWTVNILPDDTKPKYAYIKHCSSGKKKRHFTADMNEITLQGDFENYYILPDVDPSVGVEITTSYEPENYIVEEYQHLVLDERPKKRASKDDSGRKKKKRLSNPPVKEEPTDWVIENNIVYEQDEDFDDPKKVASRVRRKNKKYLGYDFVT